MKNLWARMGFTIPVEDETYEKLQSLMKDNTQKSNEEAVNILWNCFNNGKPTQSGECYLPDGNDVTDNPNKGFEFDF